MEGFVCEDDVLKEVTVPVKKEDFQWNKICPTKDYYYFLDARVYAHINTLTRSYPNSNFAYLCAKDNGDLNAVFTKVKNIPDGYAVALVKGYDNATFSIYDLARVDVATGQLGDYVYGLSETFGGLLIHKIPFNLFVQKQKIIETLEWYRLHGVSDANGRFDDLYKVALSKITVIRTDPRKPKKMLFKYGEV